MTMLPSIRFSASLLAGIGAFAIVMAAAAGASTASTLSNETMMAAIRYLGVISGGELPAEDAAWIRQQWAIEHQLSPRSVAADVDDLAFSYERHLRDNDPIRLAEARARIAKQTYCAARQSSDPMTRRLRDILAPADLVLASDCVLGLVVTHFDVDGLLASHALTASIAGQDYSKGDDHAEVLGAVTEGFAAATPQEKGLIANGELRYAVLHRFWSRIQGSPEQAALVDGLRSAVASDLNASARELETLALSKLQEVDYLAKAEGATLTAGSIGSHQEWFERVAGYNFNSRDRDWIERTIVEEFKDNPEKVLADLGNTKVLNRTYVLADTADEKASLRASWAAHLHCSLRGSDDPDKARLADVIFRDDPVVEADCEAGSVRRKRQTVIAESKGQKLLEQDLDVSMRFASMILGRPLLQDETALIREDDMQAFKDDPQAWREQSERNRGQLANVEKHDDSIFLGMDERKKLFDPIYCALKVSDDAYADDYLAMFRKDGAILHEDCSKQLVTTEEEIQAIVGAANFLALLNDKPPLEPDQVEDLRHSFKSAFLGHAESALLALKEWWSLLSLEEKAEEAQRAKREGITIEADSAAVARYIERAKLDVVVRNARRESCRTAAIITQGQTAIFGAQHGPDSAATDSPLGIAGQQLAGLVATTNALGELCKDAFGG